MKRLNAHLRSAGLVGLVILAYLFLMKGLLWLEAQKAISWNDTRSFMLEAAIIGLLLVLVYATFVKRWAVFSSVTLVVWLGSLAFILSRWSGNQCRAVLMVFTLALTLGSLIGFYFLNLKHENQ